MCSGLARRPTSATSSRCTAIPIYAGWADGPTDEQLLPFLADVTRWLAGGREVLFAEFGLPTYRVAIRWARRSDVRTRAALSRRQAAAAYTERALAALQAGRLHGRDALVLLRLRLGDLEGPALDLAVHERSFGLWRADGSPKPSVAVVEAFAGARRLDAPDEYPWIDLEPDEYLVDPKVELPRLYGLYRMSARAG